MARIKYPQLPETTEKLSLLMQGFLIEVGKDGQMTIFLKVDAGVLRSVLSGCKISLWVSIERRRPVIYLKIYDNPKAPLWFRDIVLEKEEIYLDHLNNIFVALREEKLVTLSLFDLSLMPVAAYDTGFDYEPERWKSWAAKFLAAGDSTEVDDYEIPIHPVDGKSIPKTITIVQYFDDEGQVVNSHSFDYNTFFEGSAHGYAQENSLKSVLINYFKVGETLFVSPKYSEVIEEFIDFVLLLPDTVVLIESKCATRASKVNRRLCKAAKQLDRARKDIYGRVDFLADKRLCKAIGKKSHVVTLCIYNSSIRIQNHRGYLESLEKTLPLPVYLSTTALFQSLGAIQQHAPDDFLKGFEEFVGCIGEGSNH